MGAAVLDSLVVVIRSERRRNSSIVEVSRGIIGGEREYRYKALTANLALAYHSEFEDPLPVAPEPSDTDLLGVGMWSLMHSLYVQCGYDWYDENDTCVRALQNRLKLLAAYRGADAAREEYERIREAWVEYGEELERWLVKNTVDEASEP